MKRKILFRATAVILAIASLAATVVVKISEFPAVTTPADTDLLLLASGATNKNITFANFRNAIGGTSGTAVNNIYVTNISVTNINVQNVTLKGKSIAETYVNATDVLRPNFKDGAAITFVASVVTNITPTLGALTGDVTSPANSLATTIANSAVTDAKVSASAAIARSKLAAGTANHILINDGSGVASSEATLGATRFPAMTGDVTTPGGSLASTIAANAVTLPKLVNATTTQRVLGRNTAGSGNWEEVTVSQINDWIGSTRGSILYRGASGWSALTPGTSGYLLTANGAGADPTWTVASAGGLVTSASQFAIVGGSASGTANWTALSNAYVTATTATPNGNALATGNRYTIFLLPGVYDMGSSSLTIDTDFIDIVGMSQHTGQMETRHSGGSSAFNFGDTILQSSGVVLKTPNSISAAQSDNMIANVMLYSTGGVTFTPGTGGTGDRWQMKNVLIHRSLNSAAAMADVVYRGYYYNVRCFNDYAFGSGVTGSPQSQFILCVGGRYAWSGYSGISDGQYYYCVGGISSFGAVGANGSYYYCHSIGDGFGPGGPFAGYGYYSVSDGIGFGGNGGSFTGTVIGCTSLGAWAPTVASGTISGCYFTGWNGAYAMNTADSTQISNTAAESNFSTTKSIAASAWKVGRAFKWQAWGKYSCTNVTPGTITFKTKFGATAANTSDALALPTGGTANSGWVAQGMFVCRTIGAAGTISSQSKWEMDQGTLGILNESLKPSNGTTTIANNGSLTFQISVTFSAASASNAATLENFLVQPLDAN